MTEKMYSIRDAKAESFNQPFPRRTHGEAERDFKSLVNNPESFVGKHPEDYDLYYLGDFDINSGKISALDTPQHMIKAIQLVDQKTGNGPKAVDLN